MWPFKKKSETRNMTNEEVERIIEAANTYSRLLYDPDRSRLSSKAEVKARFCVLGGEAVLSVKAREPGPTYSITIPATAEMCRGSCLYPPTWASEIVSRLDEKKKRRQCGNPND